MLPMFDNMRPAVKLIDTDKLQVMLQGVEDSMARDYIIKGFLADQNRNGQTIVAPLATDAYANLIGMETNPLITPEEFMTLMGTLAALGSGGVTQEQLPDILAGIAPVLQKLKVYENGPSLQTGFDAQGFSSEVLKNVPELEKYIVTLIWSAHVRIDPKPQATDENEPA